MMVVVVLVSGAATIQFGILVQSGCKLIALKDPKVRVWQSTSSTIFVRFQRKGWGMMRLCFMLSADPETRMLSISDLAYEYGIWPCKDDRFRC